MNSSRPWFHHRAGTCVLGFVLLSAASPVLRAQDASEEVVELSEFTISSSSADRYRSADAISAVRVRAPLIDTASSISVVTREMMDDIGGTRIFDVTRYIAGIQDGRGRQFQDRMIIRGFESNGQRTVDNFIQPDDADNIADVVVDRIEVTKGPNAILSPAGAPGGSVNVILKSPLYQPRRTLSATIGLYDAQKVWLDVTAPFSEGSKHAYRVVGSYQDSSRYWDSDAKLKGKVLAPMYSFKISDETLFTAKAVLAEHWIFREPLLILDPSVTAQTDEPFLAPGIGKKSLNGIQDWSHVGTHTADLFMQLTTRLAKKYSLRIAANGRYYFEDSEQQFLSTPSFNASRYNPTTGELTQDYTWAAGATPGTWVSTFSPYFNPTAIPNRGDKQATRRKNVALQGDLAFKDTLGEVNLQTVTGFAVGLREAYGRGYNGTMPAINLVNPDMRIRPVYATNYAFYNEQEFLNWQVYLNERISFADDRVQVTGGILHYDTHTESRNVLTGAAPSVLDDAKDMWMASILFKVKDNISLYYSHSTNAAPTIANGQPLWREGVQDEIGFKTEFLNRRLSFNGAWFQIEQTNVTIPNPERQTNPSAPEQIVSDFGNDGFELELTGRISEQLSAIATYSHLNMRDSLGRHVRGVADNNASTLLSYRFAENSNLDGVSVHFGMSYSGKRAGDTPINYTLANVVAKTSFYLEPEYVTMLGASWHASDALLFRLHVDNVFDKKGYIQQAGGRVSGTGITTAPGRNIKLTTTFSF